nr:MAG TPA: hypothetical protein [Caudoviricetes sp.]
MSESKNKHTLRRPKGGAEFYRDYLRLGAGSCFFGWRPPIIATTTVVAWCSTSAATTTRTATAARST